MKNNLIILISLMLLLLTKAQAQSTQPNNGSTHYFLVNLGAASSETVEEVIGSIRQEVSKNFEIEKFKKISVAKVKDDTVYFNYLEFDNDNKEKDKKQKDKENGASTDTVQQVSLTRYNIYNKEDDSALDKIFQMSLADFYRYTKPFYRHFRGFKFGAYTIPIRLRNSIRKNKDGTEKKNFEFNSNLSLGANIIGRLSLSRKRKHSYVDLSFGVGITKVDLNPTNSALGTGEYADIDAQSPAAFTLSGGSLFTVAKNVNMGFYFGWDYLSSADQKAQWIYNKKPWYGIGLNVTLSGKNEAENNTQGASN